MAVVQTPRSSYPPRNRRIRVPALLGAAAMAAVLITGCADEDDSLPAVQPDAERTNQGGGDATRSDDPSSTSSDNTSGDPADNAPKAAKLNRDEQAAYDKAAGDQNDWAKVAADLAANPSANDATYTAIKKWAYDPYASDYFAKLQRFAEEGVRLEGRTEVLWRVPVRVNLDARWPRMVWKECVGDGTLRVYRNGKRVQQDNTTPHASRITLQADATGRWRPLRTKDLGPCGA